jgi:hypothetical protein
MKTREATVMMETDFSQEEFEAWLLKTLKNIAIDPSTVKVKEQMKEEDNKNEHEFTFPSEMSICFDNLPSKRRLTSL